MAFIAEKLTFLSKVMVFRILKAKFVTISINFGISQNAPENKKIENTMSLHESHPPRHLSDL